MLTFYETIIIEAHKNLPSPGGGLNLIVHPSPSQRLSLRGRSPVIGGGVYWARNFKFLWLGFGNGFLGYL
jgi:hypothetical protein